MKFDEAQRAAIEKACDEIGKSTFAKLAKVPISSPGKWIDGLLKGCQEQTYERIFPLIEKHLPAILAPSGGRAHLMLA